MLSSKTPFLLFQSSNKTHPQPASTCGIWSLDRLPKMGCSQKLLNFTQIWENLALGLTPLLSLLSLMLVPQCWILRWVVVFMIMFWRWVMCLIYI
uniref:Pentatricopeptide repeat-containing protein At3g03580-like n=1 Tax=Rhizophora mucronata TaxID=61149 RepID=A0A2P2IPD6_RHIMU